MSYRSAFTLFSLVVLTACAPRGIPSDATEGEIAMADMMGITVEELRTQTPEEHMQMMMGMQHGKRQTETGPEEGTMTDPEVAALPEARPPKELWVKDGETVELRLTMVKKTIRGVTFPMYGYNGSIPGPIIRARQASVITVQVRNDIDMESTVHWHGVRLDNANDGVPDVTQPPIEPGSSFTYTVKLPDDGVYWYHPHVREDIQQELGLYGNLIVSPASGDAEEPVNAEKVLVLDDILLEHGRPAAFRTDTTLFPLMGRFGNTFLLNGEPAPAQVLKVSKGSVVRFYLTNVASTRTFRVRFQGAETKLVGADVGRYARETWTDAVTLAPAERAIVDVHYPSSGTFKILHESPLSTVELGTVAVDATPADPSHLERFKTLASHADVLADIDDFRPFFDAPVLKTLRMTIRMQGPHGMMQHGMMHGDDSGIEWEDAMPMMNAAMTDEDLRWILRDDETGKENMDIDWEFKRGDVAKIRVINDRDSAHPMQHPFHIHGQRFLVLSMDGTKNTNLAWKDTVLIPAGLSADLLVDMSNPGTWMFHCHIAEHLQNGMMGSFLVR